MTELRIAVIGCGAAARGCHLPALPRLPGLVRLTALVDPVPAHAADALAQHRAAGGATAGVRLASRIEEVLDDFDAAVVAAPHVLHAPLAESLLRRGKHVLLEKPMAVTSDEAERLVGVVARHPAVVFAMAHPRRLFPASRWIHRLIHSGELGELQRVEWREGSPYSWQPTTSSMFDAALAGGGVVVDTGSHVFDLLCWWLGADAEMVDYRDNSRGGVETDARLTLRWPRRGVDAVVEFSRLRPLGTTCSVAGSAASATIGTDFPAGECRLLRHDGTVLHRGDVAAIPPAQDEWEELFVEQLRNFAAAARGSAAPYSTVQDGQRVVNLIEACYRGPARGSWPQPWICVRS